MSDDLVRRLRDHSYSRNGAKDCHLINEAADCIETLELALQEIARTGDTAHDTWTLATVQSARARRALETQLDILAENIVGRTESTL